jgi:[protein-PII] uridylyltransferase
MVVPVAITADLVLPEPPEGSYHDHLDALPEFEPGTAANRVLRAHTMLDRGRQAIRALHQQGASGQTVVRLTSTLSDRLVQGLFEELRAELSTNVGASDTNRCALVALGGYGRRELAPRSDLDLMLLLPSGMRSDEPSAQKLAEALLYVLWDLKFEVGWSVRDPAQCADAAAEDHTARTALLDCRFVAGNEASYAELERAVLDDLLGRNVERFIADKAEELSKRRLKYGDTVYLLEPNLKQSEGGMRDLQAALWIALARFRARGLTELLQKSVLPPREVRALKAARDFLWRVRNEMHFESGRKEDRLNFELQEKVATFLRYKDGPLGTPVEQFMRDYYLCARHIKQAAEALVSRCEEKPHSGRVKAHKVGDEFKLWGNQLTLAEADLFEREPLAMVRLFATSDRENLPLYSFARDKVAHELPRLNAPELQQPAAKLLAEMMARPGTLGAFLPAMHELGVLGAILPEFGRVTALRQHDLYHVYTVDVHSLFAVQKLYALRAGEWLEQQPELTHLMQELPNPLPLYLGMLFHDAGKGMGGNHSERGAELVRRVAERMGFSDADRDDAEFLVLKHLLMSHTSQRRDLSDPGLIDSFAKECGSPRRLSLLYLLTWADICSVGPTTWTDWKARLLRELFQKSQEALGVRTAEASATSRYIELRDQVATRHPYAEVESFLRSMPHRYLSTVTARRASHDLKLLRRCAQRPLGALLLQHREQSFTTLSLTAPDKPGLLSIFAGVLAAHGVDILSADVYSAQAGPNLPPRALDIFEVRGPRGEPLSRERFAEVKRDLTKVLTGIESVSQVMQRRAQGRLPSRRLPPVTTHVQVDNQASRDFTVIDVVAQDRVGLLYAITRELFELEIDVVAARIVTEAHRAIDAFYVRHHGKRITDHAEVEALQTRLRQALEAK